MKRCVLRISDGLFVTASGGPVFKTPFSMEIWAQGHGAANWAITGPQKSQLLNVIASKHIAKPALLRQYPALAQRFRQDEIQYLNFRESTGLDKVHLAARYESYSYKGKLEMDDVNSLENYLTGRNNYNKSDTSIDERLLQELMDRFNLQHLRTRWVNSLSNGQMRRARIARALFAKPTLLVVDDPFLGLDPKATVSVSDSLKSVARALDTSIVLGLRAEDAVPSWVTHMGYASEPFVFGEKAVVAPQIPSSEPRGELILTECEKPSAENPIIEFHNASVSYKGKSIFKDFSWSVEKGLLWRIRGDNGTGKTTLLSLITADHPQLWRSVVSVNGQLRKTGLGVGYFDVNNGIGMSSPELHAVVPRSITFKELVLNGLVRNIGNSNFGYRYKGDVPAFAKKVIDTFGVNDTPFWALTVLQQKLALFMRAVVKQPAILILDEAFSCMDDMELMRRCHEFVASMGTTVLLIGHIDWEVAPHQHELRLDGGFRFFEVSR